MNSASTSSTAGGICPGPTTSSPITNQNMPSTINFGQQRCQQPSAAGGQSTPSTSKDSNRDYSGLHLEMFELLCTFHRVKRIQSKDTTQCGQLIQDIGLGNEQRAEFVNRSMYRILNEIETKIIILPNTMEPVNADYFDEWSFLAWALLLIINRLEAMDAQEIALLDYGGKHFQEKIHAALVDLVNKAHRMQPPPTVQSNDQQFDRFYQAYGTALISLHELYTMSQRNDQMMYSEFEAHIGHFKKQMVACFVLQREFANCHGFMILRQLREHQIRKMTHFGYENKGFLDSAVSFYAHMLYNLGVLAARLQGFSYALRGSMAAVGELVKPLLAMVYQMADVLLSDSIICLEPSQNPILVTNNLFPMKIVSLCRFSFFRDFSLQIVSEEVAQQIHQEMRHRKTFDPPSPIRKTQTAALLAMKPATGVKRNNAKASEEGGNTAHKKSDVNSKEWISIPPIFDAEHVGWCATYPHLLCTTRQKDTLLETRSTMQTGKRPLFYFHVRAELFSFSGGFSTAHTLSLPFTIATRRNQDCQVQRMMSSYTATCFWLYGTNVLDGLLIHWFDGEIEWKHFKLLYSLYFAMNAEVMRTFTDEDFNILQQKMHCPECTENSTSQQQKMPLARISFKNVLCPHLHFSTAKCDLRFSVWRGMLELLHLFNDQKTETRNLWEVGLLQGFLELKTVHSMLRPLPGSGLIMRLSLVAGACVCITVKCFNGELLDLEPLDVKRLQAKNLHDFLKDIILVEKVDFVLDSNKEWVHVVEVMKRCQKCSSPGDQVPSQPKTREVLSNAMHPGPVEKEHRISFTTMRIAVVTCKANTADNNNEPDDEFGEHSKVDNTVNDGGFEQNLEQLLRRHGKTREQAMEILTRMAQQRRNNNNAPQIHYGGQMDAVQPSASIQSDQKSQNSPTFYLSVPLAQDGPSSGHMGQSNLPPSSMGTIPPSSTPSSSFSTALASSVEDSYPTQRHHQNQQHQLYFGTNSSMQTMNMPIVVMPAHSQTNSSSFMLFPANPNSAPTIMTFGTLNDQQMGHPPFSVASTTPNNPLLHSHAFQIGSIQSTSNAPTTLSSSSSPSSCFHSSAHHQHSSHSHHHRHLLLANNSPIAIVHQPSPHSQSSQIAIPLSSSQSQYQNATANDQQQHSQMPQHSAGTNQPQQSTTQFPPQIM